MINALSHSFIWVLDQDEALDFYVGKLGFEIHTDAQLEFMRWLTVNVPGHPEHELVLMVPGPPALDPDTAEEVKQLLGKGAGAGFIVTTDDCRATYDERVAKGVEFSEEPVERFYGIDVGLRDPFGNPLRITQPAEVPAQ
jgi:catechol 2,3-dioxygenase-like lactoylglutathione lyase family enzyme